MKHDKKNTRGEFIKTLAVGTAGAGLVMTMPEFAKGSLMGNQSHAGEGNRLIKEWIQDGAIDAVSEVHVWTDRSHWLLAPGRRSPRKEDASPT